MNIRQAQNKAGELLAKSSINTPEIDTKVLLKFVLDKDDTYIIRSGNSPITNSQYSRYMRYIKRRAKGEPVAYITHHKEFYGLDFYINKNVLIPRPETESLVEEAIRNIEVRNSKFADCSLQPKKLKPKKLNVVDIGTGSGCIIISLLKVMETKSWQLTANSYYATDVSKKALYLAKNNAKKYGVADKIKFYHSDLFSNKHLPKKYDIIITNLPYVPKSNTKNLPDPNVALDGGERGTDIILKFLDQAKTRLNDDGVILLEIGFNQAKEIRSYAKKTILNSKIQVIKDLAGLDRIIKIVFDN
jgi:release factor glutamine methyltransferase